MELITQRLLLREFCLNDFDAVPDYESHSDTQHSVHLTVWDSAALPSIFLASSFSCSQALSTPAHTQVTPVVIPTEMEAMELLK